MVRTALDLLTGEPHVESAALIWETARQAAPSRRAPAWLHGDLQPSNLVIVGDRLAGVIDFGLMGVGDPACDLMAAWTCFCGPVRSFFRDAAPGDAGDWVRGRGWALSTALIALAAYRGTHPAFESAARRTIKEVVEDRA